MVARRRPADYRPATEVPAQFALGSAAPLVRSDDDVPADINPSLEVDGNWHLLHDRQKEVLASALGGPYRHICIVGGSRSGKTTLICRAIVTRALRAEKSRHAILRFRQNAIWPTIGLDTLPNVMKRFFPDIIYTVNKSLHYFELINGSQIWLGGLDDKDRVEKILGAEYLTLYFNECSQIPYPSVITALSRLAENFPGMIQRAYYDLNPASTIHWSNVLFGDLREPGSRRPLTNPEQYKREFMNPHDNRSNLSPEYLASLDNMPERQRKRFRDGVYVDESDDALWKHSVLEACRRYSDEIPELSRMIVAIDPSGAKNELDVTHDAVGIIVAGLGRDGHVYVVEDSTVLDGPNGWGRRAIFNFHKYQADAIVAEINFGGAMVEYVIRSIDHSINYRTVTASRGKAVRAEPVAALYEQGLIHHVVKKNAADLYGMIGEETLGVSDHERAMFRDGWMELEDELTSFTVHGYQGVRSPNRADALVWAISELKLSNNAPGFVEFYRQTADGTLQITGDVPKDMSEVIRAGQPIIGPATDAPGVPGMPAQSRPAAPVTPTNTLRVKTDPYRNFSVPDQNGRSVRLTADPEGILIVPDVAILSSLLGQGCVRI